MIFIFTRKYLFAGTVFEICSIYESIHEMCKNYISEDEAEFRIEICRDDIEKESELSEKTDIAEGRKPVRYRDEYLETLAVYRKMCMELTKKDTILYHGSVIAVDGEAFLFTAKSGTGKSTHTANWRKYFGDRAVMINDDKPLLKITDNGVIAYGTPWDGKHHLSTNTSVLLKAVCILTRSETNQIEKIDPREYYGLLLQQAFRPKKAAELTKVLSLLDRFFEKTEFYKLGCNMDISSAEVAYNGMKG